MAFCQIHHVDVIAYARAVMGGPVAAKYLELFAATYGDLGHEEEVAGDAEASPIWPLWSPRVEVAEDACAKYWVHWR